MSIWQISVIEEKKELDARLAKLLDFIRSEEFGNIRISDGTLLMRQSAVMELYSEILDERIKTFKTE